VTDVLIIAVNYGTASTAWKLAESLMTQQMTTWRCIVVDNGDSLEGRVLLDKLPGLERRITLCRPKMNLGYFGGARYALSTWVREGANLPEWTIISNSDIRFESTFLQNIHTADAEIDIAAPSIRSELTGHDQNPYLMYPLTRGQIKRNYFINSHRVTAQCGRAYSIAVKRRIRGSGNADAFAMKHIYAAHGSLMCFRRTWFDRGGNLEHAPFLYGEEITIAERARRINARISYVPELRASHNEHKSTGLLLSRRIATYQAEAARYVHRLLKDT
jgi:GT2 family glycosyltransferase